MGRTPGGPALRERRPRTSGSALLTKSVRVVRQRGPLDETVENGNRFRRSFRCVGRCRRRTSSEGGEYERPGFARGAVHCSPKLSPGECCGGWFHPRFGLKKPIAHIPAESGRWG